MTTVASQMTTSGPDPLLVSGVGPQAKAEGRLKGANMYADIRTTSRSLRPGFTLAELMLVVVVAGVTMALALPRIDTTKIKADAVATIVRTTLQYAQRQAITRQHDIFVSFDTTGERIRTVWDADNSGTAERLGARHLARSRHRRRTSPIPRLPVCPATSINRPVSGVSDGRAQRLSDAHVPSRRLGEQRRRDLHQGRPRTGRRGTARSRSTQATGRVVVVPPQCSGERMGSASQ